VSVAVAVAVAVLTQYVNLTSDDSWKHKEAFCAQIRYHSD